jgi:diguanylate cyclase (GGDEF)-like protein
MLASSLGKLVPFADQLGGLQRRCVRAGMLALLLGTLTYTLATVMEWNDGVFDALLNDLLYNLLLLGTAAACIARSLLVPVLRRAWLLLGFGTLAWALGDIYWTVRLTGLEQVPYPSPADALYVLFYPFTYAALALLVRSTARRFHRSMWLDGLIGVLAVSSLAAAFVIDTILRDVGGSVGQVATNVSYPIGDLLLLLFIVGVFALHGWRPPRAWMVLAAGMAIFAVADSYYLYSEAAGTYAVGGLLDSAWLVGLVAVGFSAWQPPMREQAIRIEGRAVLVVPFVFTLAAVGLLVLGNFQHFPPVALALAGLATVIALVRVAMTFNELRELPETRRQAETDELTGLSNRRFFYRKLTEAIEKADGSSRQLAVLMIDLDRFKELNDTLGHYAGDTLLKQLGPRLQRTTRRGEILARLGGDEFGVLVPDGGVAAKVAQRIEQELELPFDIGGVTMHVDASTGIALYPDHAASAEGLLQRADVAMYEAKGEHRAFRFYAPERDQHSPERLSMVSRLRGAIEAGELVLHYQPQVEMSTGRVGSVEALVRWNDPERGLIPPADFIPIAEQTAVMRPLTLTVLEAAIAQSRSWLEEGIHLRVAVNISATNLLDETLPHVVNQLLQRYRVPPGYLRLEMTENVLMSDPARAMKAIQELSDLGVEIALDDFGTGYSSLSYLKSLAVDELKIDMSFVTNMTNDAQDAAIVRSVLEMGHSMGLRVVAEGVETEQVREQLAGLGCDLAQGFHFSKALPPEEMARWLHDRAGADPAEASPGSSEPALTG